MDLADIAALARPEGNKVVLLVLDGLGGLPREPGGLTELETAHTPNLDALARDGGCGLHTPVAAGVTPGSGPGHLSLFGFDPLRYRIGRGVLEGLGVGFDLRPGDVAVRGNLCTVDAEGRVTDRRAGRISSGAAAPVCELLDGIDAEGASVFVRHVKEHRFLLVVRPDGGSGGDVGEAAAAGDAGDIEDTDPERTGVLPLPVRARTPAAEPAAAAVRSWLKQVPAALADQAQANMVLLRGFATLPSWPRFTDVFRMRALAVAAYPMYRGVARLVGMEAVAVGDRVADLVEELERRIDEFDFFFLHIKGTDKAGEDGDFDRKVQVIEEADELIPRLVAAARGVLLVTGDHSTPATMEAHSWHPVPFVLSGGPARGGIASGISSGITSGAASGVVSSFGESDCARGSLGPVMGWELLPLAVARAGRLAKYGA